MATYVTDYTAILNTEPGGYLHWFNATIDYGFNTGLALNLPGDKFYAASVMSADEQAAAQSILAAYAAVADLHFQQTGLNSVDANGAIALVNAPLSSSESGLTRGYVNLPHLNQTGYMDLYIDSSSGSSPAFQSAAPGGLLYLTLIHELGHAIGFKHPGAYDASGRIPPGPYLPAGYDSTQYTVMSYNDYSGYSYGGGKIAPMTPMLFDVQAAQALYGVNYATRSGDTVYGFNSSFTNADNPQFNFALTPRPVITIWDGGGSNTLDLSGYAGPSTIDLNQGAFSSAGGLTNNIAIAYGVHIDTAIGGSEADVIIGNNDGDVLNGGGGNDIITGGAGADTLIAGSGSNLLTGGGGLNRFELAAGGHDTIADFKTGPGGDVATLVGTAPQVSIAQSSTDNILWHDATGATAVWDLIDGHYYSYAALPKQAAEFALVGYRDFNGDGATDLLWRSAAGRDAIWFLSAAGGYAGYTLLPTQATRYQIAGMGDFGGFGSGLVWEDAAARTTVLWAISRVGGYGGDIVLPRGPAGFALLGAGDFNRDGQTDLVWRNQTTGAVAIWLTRDGGYAGYLAAPAQSAAFTLAGVGDFRGDGTTGIVWQSAAGVAELWAFDRTGAYAGQTALPNLPAGFAIVSTGDFNGDGATDLLLKNASGASAIWFLSYGRYAGYASPPRQAAGYAQAAAVSGAIDTTLSFGDGTQLTLANTAPAALAGSNIFVDGAPLGALLAPAAASGLTAAAHFAQAAASASPAVDAFGRAMLTGGAGPAMLTGGASIAAARGGAGDQMIAAGATARG